MMPTSADVPSALDFSPLCMLSSSGGTGGYRNCIIKVWSACLECFPGQNMWIVW